mgnify:CR=1 FL=1
MKLDPRDVIVLSGLGLFVLLVIVAMMKARTLER